MIARLFLVLALAVAMFAARGPVDLADGPEATISMLDGDVADHVVVTDAAMPDLIRVAQPQLHVDIDLAPNVPELSRVFRPPRG